MNIQHPSNTKNFEKFTNYINITNRLSKSDIICLTEAQWFPQTEQLWRQFEEESNFITFGTTPKSKAKILVKSHLHKHSTLVDLSTFYNLPIQLYDYICAIKIPTIGIIFSVYAPQDTKMRTMLFQYIKEYLSQLDSETAIILAGDFNAILFQTDTDKEKYYKPNQPDVKSLRKLVTANELTDSLDLDPSGVNYFTNEMGQNSAKRRLDRCYISNHFISRHIKHTTHGKIPNSTHYAVSVSLSQNQVPPPRFRVSAKWLQVPQWITRLNMSEARSILTSSKLDSFIRFNLFSSYMEQEARKTQQEFFSIMKVQQGSKIIQQVNRQAQMGKSPIPYQDYEALNKSFRRFEMENKILSIQKDEIKATTTTEQLELLAAHFEEQFQEPAKYSKEKYHAYTNKLVKKISKKQYSQLRKPLTAEELWQTLLKLAPKKTSPGANGLTYEFIKQYWELYQKILPEVATQIVNTESLPDSMRTTILTVVPKTDSRHLDIGEIRPISLLDTCLKLICSTWNNRLEPVITSLVKKDQVGFCKDRQMETIVQDYIATAHSSSTNMDPKSNGAMYIADFKKAFDTINITFIADLLQTAGFPKEVINLARATMFGSTTTIQLQNQYSRLITMKVGTRQGNPLSPTFFILGLETLLADIRRSTKGHIVPIYEQLSYNIQTRAFADDVSIFLNGKTDAKAMLKCFKNFKQFSNLEVNPAKSKLLYLSTEETPIRTKTQRKKKLSQAEQSDKLKDWKDKFNKEYEIIGTPGIFLDKNSNPKLLGIELNKVDWPSLEQRVLKLIRYPFIHHNPVTTRTLSYSIYALSIIYYRDNHSPIGEASLNRILAAISKQFPGISMDTLQPPKKLGGFGLINMEKQLLGHRAKMIYYCIIDSHYYSYLDTRVALQRLAIAITKVFKLHPSERVKTPMGEKRIGGRIFEVIEEGLPNVPKSSSGEKPRITREIPVYWWNTITGFAWYNILDNTLLHYFRILSEDSYFQKELKISNDQVERMNSMDL